MTSQNIVAFYTYMYMYEVQKSGGEFALEINGTAITCVDWKKLTYLQLVFQYRHFFVRCWTKLSPGCRVPEHDTRTLIQRGC